jgi:hypothetical protein
MSSEAAKLKDRLRKAEARKLAKENGTHDPLKRNRALAITNINKGINVIADTIKKYNITLNDVTPDHTIINPEVLRVLKPLPRITILKKPTGKIPIRPKPFDIETANAVFNDPKHNLSAVSRNNYISRFKVVIEKVLKVKSEETIKYLRQPNFVYDMIKSYRNLGKPLSNPWQYISPIVSLAKYSPEFKALIGDDNLKLYSEMASQGSKLDVEAKLQEADTGSVVDWQDLLKIARNIATTQPFSQAHLLSALYTQLPPLRDDYGKVKIYMTPPHPIPKDQNMYISSTKTIIINRHKTYKSRGTITIYIPDWSQSLDSLIKESISKMPRDYLITTDDNHSNDIYAREGKLEERIAKAFNGYTVNAIRHSGATYVYYHPELYPPSRVIDYARIMGHSLEMHIKYVRAGKP